MGLSGMEVTADGSDFFGCGCIQKSTAHKASANYQARKITLGRENRYTWAMYYIVCCVQSFQSPTAYIPIIPIWMNFCFQLPPACFIFIYPHTHTPGWVVHVLHQNSTKSSFLNMNYLYTHNVQGHYTYILPSRNGIKHWNFFNQSNQKNIYVQKVKKKKKK